MGAQVERQTIHTLLRETHIPLLNQLMGSRSTDISSRFETTLKHLRSNSEMISPVEPLFRLPGNYPSQSVYLNTLIGRNEQQDNPSYTSFLAQYAIPHLRFQLPEETGTHNGSIHIDLVAFEIIRALAPKLGLTEVELAQVKPGDEKNLHSYIQDLLPTITQLEFLAAGVIFNLPPTEETFQQFQRQILTNLNVPTYRIGEIIGQIISSVWDIEERETLLELNKLSQNGAARQANTKELPLTPPPPPVSTLEPGALASRFMPPTPDITPSNLASRFMPPRNNDR